MAGLHNVFVRSALVDLRAEATAIARSLELMKGELGADAAKHVARARALAAGAAAELHMALQGPLMPRIVEHVGPAESASA